MLDSLIGSVHCVSQVLLPAIYVINKLLAEARGDKPPIAVTLRGQLPMPNDPTCTVDHALVIDSHQRIEPDPTILVLFEEKVWFLDDKYINNPPSAYHTNSFGRHWEAWLHGTPLSRISEISQRSYNLK